MNNSLRKSRGASFRSTAYAVGSSQQTVLVIPHSLFIAKVTRWKQDLGDRETMADKVGDMISWAVFALLLAAFAVAEEGKHTRFEYKLSFKGPHLVNKQGKVPFWNHYGSKWLEYVLSTCTNTSTNTNSLCHGFGCHSFRFMRRCNQGLLHK